MTQNHATGGQAARFGHKGAALIGEKIGASKISSKSNEFDFNGQRVTIRLAHMRTNQVGVLYAMLERVQAVIGAFEIASNEYGLLSISPDTFKRSMRDSKTGQGRVGLVRKTVFIEKGERLGAVTISV